MKRNTRTIRFLILLFTVLVNFSYTIPKQPDTRLKVMTYNIWNGFEWGKDTVRKAQFIHWVQAQQPDVLALQELCGYDEEQLKADAAKWGHPYVQLLKTEGYPTGLTSRKPIVLKERATDGLWHGLLHAETYGIDFFVVHLSPADCDFRLREASLIADRVKRNGNGKFMILGDFNAHSPFDGEELKHNQYLLDQYAQNKSEQYSNLRLGEFDYAVMSAFLALPTIDITQIHVEAKERYTYPSPALIGKYRENLQEVIQTRGRIDYILTSPALAQSCKNVMIHNKEETAMLSDHYPIMAEFEIAD